jgi:hypothetical protein
VNFIAEHGDILIGIGVGAAAALVGGVVFLLWLFKDFRIR